MFLVTINNSIHHSITKVGLDIVKYPIDLNNIDVSTKYSLIKIYSLY